MRRLYTSPPAAPIFFSSTEKDGRMQISACESFVLILRDSFSPQREILWRLISRDLVSRPCCATIVEIRVMLLRGLKHKCICWVMQFLVVLWFCSWVYYPRRQWQQTYKKENTQFSLRNMLSRTLSSFALWSGGLSKAFPFNFYHLLWRLNTYLQLWQSVCLCYFCYIFAHLVLFIQHCFFCVFCSQD